MPSSPGERPNRPTSPAELAAWQAGRYDALRRLPAPTGLSDALPVDLLDDLDASRAAIGDAVDNGLLELRPLD